MSEPPGHRRGEPADADLRRDDVRLGQPASVDQVVYDTDIAEQLHMGSEAMRWRQRSYKTDRPIWDAIQRELGTEPKTLNAFIEASQETQALGYEKAIQSHLGKQPWCMGTLFWQLNDCWPGPSWSLVDYAGNWKPGMLAVERLYGR